MVVNKVDRQHSRGARKFMFASVSVLALNCGFISAGAAAEVIDVPLGDTHNIPGNYSGNEFSGGQIFGVLNSNIEISNSYTLNIGPTGRLNNFNGLVNSATINNDGTLANSFVLTNYGSLINNNTLDNAKWLDNWETLDNIGTLNNNDTLTNRKVLNNSGRLVSTGTFNNPGILNNSGFLGGEINNSGTINIAGSTAIWNVGGDLITGDPETAVLKITDGGKVESNIGYIGKFETGVGSVTVEGKNAQWVNAQHINVGLDGIGTLTIANDGLVAVGDGVGGAGTVYLGRGALGFGTINIGGAAGEAPTGAGSLVAASVNFGEGMGTLNFNHTSFMTFSSALTSTGSSGTHALNHYAGTTLLTGDSSGFSGLTTVSGGTLLVGGNNGNGKLGGLVTVTTGGTLGGYGTIGSGTGSTVTLGADSIVAPGLAPGNSIGTLTIDGDLKLAAGSVYQTGIGSSGGSDRIDVSGTARVTDGHVVVTMLDSETSYQYGQTYTILNAAGGVSGQFADAITQSAFLDLLLSHRANAVDLIVQLKNKAPDPDKPDPVKLDPLFGTVAETNNQFSTAATLDTLAQTGSSLALYNKLLMLDASTARAAFDSLSGEIHASAKTALIEDSRFIRNAANDRIRAAFDGVGASAAPVLAYGPDGAALATTNTERFAAWGSGFGNWGAANSDGNAAKFKHDTGGFLVGADGFVTDNWRLGLLTGYSHTSFNVKDRAASGSSDNYHLGLYGGTRWGNLGFRSGLAYTWHNVETGRSVAFPGFSDSLEADYSAGTFQAFGELGYQLDTAVASFEPFINLAHVSLRTDGYTEHGGAAALHSGSQTTDSTFTTLGLRASTGFMLGTMSATARGTVGWRHAYGDTTPLATHSFASGDAFTVAGVPIAGDSAILEAGFDLNLTEAATLGISYSGQLASRAHDHGFKAILTVKF